MLFWTGPELFDHTKIQTIELSTERKTERKIKKSKKPSENLQTVWRMVEELLIQNHFNRLQEGLDQWRENEDLDQRMSLKAVSLPKAGFFSFR